MEEEVEAAGDAEAEDLDAFVVEVQLVIMPVYDHKLVDEQPEDKPINRYKHLFCQAICYQHPPITIRANSTMKNREGPIVDGAVPGILCGVL